MALLLILALAAAADFFPFRQQPDQTHYAKDQHYAGDHNAGRDHSTAQRPVSGDNPHENRTDTAHRTSISAC